MWAEEVPYGLLVFVKTLAPECHNGDEHLPSLGGFEAPPQTSLQPRARSLGDIGSPLGAGRQEPSANSPSHLEQRQMARKTWQHRLRGPGLRTRSAADLPVTDVPPLPAAAQGSAG